MSENKEYISQIDDQSNIHISETAICTVVAMAAVEVEGVGGLSNLGADMADIAAHKNLSKAVRVREEEGQLSIDLSVLVQFGSNIQSVAKAVQDAVKAEMESVIGLPVSAVNVYVSGVVL